MIFNYFYLNYLAKIISKYKSKIYNTQLAHGHYNLQLEILEVCARSHVIKQGQFNIDYFKAEYDILITGEFSLDFKHYE